MKFNIELPYNLNPLSKQERKLMISETISQLIGVSSFQEYLYLHIFSSPKK